MPMTKREAIDRFLELTEGMDQEEIIKGLLRWMTAEEIQEHAEGYWDLEWEEEDTEDEDEDEEDDADNDE